MSGEISSACALALVCGCVARQTLLLPRDNGICNKKYGIVEPRGHISGNARGEVAGTYTERKSAVLRILIPAFET